MQPVAADGCQSRLDFPPTGNSSSERRVPRLQRSEVRQRPVLEPAAFERWFGTRGGGGRAHRRLPNPNPRRPPQPLVLALFNHTIASAAPLAPPLRPTHRLQRSLRLGRLAAVAAAGSEPDEVRLLQQWRNAALSTHGARCLAYGAADRAAQRSMQVGSARSVSTPAVPPADALCPPSARAAFAIAASQQQVAADLTAAPRLRWGGCLPAAAAARRRLCHVGGGRSCRLCRPFDGSSACARPAPLRRLLCRQLRLPQLQLLHQRDRQVLLLLAHRRQPLHH